MPSSCAARGKTGSNKVSMSKKHQLVSPVKNNNKVSLLLHKFFIIMNVSLFVDDVDEAADNQ